MSATPFRHGPTRDGASAFAGLGGRLAVVSNRLPLRLVHDDEGTRVVPGSGGLVTALAPILGRLDGIWVGWDGQEEEGEGREAFRRASDVLPHPVHPVALSADLAENYYAGFANETIWPLFHDFLDRTRFRRKGWEAYREANRRFAEAALEATDEGDTIWAQDYHLGFLGQEVRRRARRRLVWFLHIPFPPVETFARLPWRRELLEGLLAYDLVGFQTRRHLANFLSAVRALVPGARVLGAGGSTLRQVEFAGRRLAAGWFPISIDFQEFDGLARSRECAEAAWRIHADLPDRQLVLGVDRLDYTKGTAERMRAFELFLARHPEMHGKATLVQVAVPSRENVPEYRRMRADLERTVGRINGRFTRAGWVPIHYVYRSLSRVELVGHYRTSEVALVTPLRDGMNLVAKEYVASSVDAQGVLILSEFAGAASQLAGGSLMVNPHHTEQVADAIHRALTMEPAEKAERLRRMRRQVRENDVHHWARDFAEAAAHATGTDRALAGGRAG